MTYSLRYGSRGDNSSLYFQAMVSILCLGVARVNLCRISHTILASGPYNFKSPLDWNVDNLVAIGKRNAAEMEPATEEHENNENLGNSHNEARIAKRAKGGPESAYSTFVHPATA
jgi:hypothetical protein